MLTPGIQVSPALNTRGPEHILTFNPCKIPEREQHIQPTLINQEGPETHVRIQWTQPTLGDPVSKSERPMCFPYSAGLGWGFTRQ